MSLPLLQMGPATAGMDISNCRAVNAKPFGDSYPRLLPSKGENFPGLLIRKFRHAVARASRAGAMGHLVGFVLNLCLPREVTLGYTPEMTIPAGVRGLMAWRRGRTTCLLTEKARNGTEFSACPDFPIAVSARGIRPHQALVAIVRKIYFQIEPVHLTSPGPARERVSVPVMTPVVLLAKTLCISGPATTIDEACGKLRKIEDAKAHRRKK